MGEENSEEGEGFANAFLEHYGIKGMKWGVHRKASSQHEDRTVEGSTRTKLGFHKKPQLSGPSPIVLKTAPGAKIKTAGGQNHSPSEDAKRVAVFKQQAKASTTDSLSTKELRDLVDRMNLEQQYGRLNPQQESLGKKFVKNSVPLALKFGSGMAVNAAKSKYGDTPDPKVQVALKLGEMVAQQLQQGNGNGKKKK